MWIRLLALVIGLVASLNLATAQEQAPPPLAPVYTPNDALFPAPPPPVDAALETPAPPSLMFDFVFGLPIQLRLQHQIADTRAWIEGGLALYVIVPSVFVGLRFDQVLHQGKQDGMKIRPGFDVFYSPIRGSGFFGNFEGIGVVAADVDIVWQHQWKNGMYGSLGLKLGCGVGAAGGGNGVFPVPILGMTMGLAY